MTIARILIVDDDSQIRRAVGTGLRAHGFDVAGAGNGETALEVAVERPPDIVILDLGLPGIDGFEVIRRLRSWSDVPIIVLSVQEAQGDKVAAFDLGADDYLTKPFGMEELLARLRALLRRSGSEKPAPVLRFGDLEVDRARSLVTLGGEQVHLTKTESALLEALVSHPGKLLTHSWLLQQVWGPGYGGESHYLRVYVRQLRRKLADDPGDPRWIITEPGLGYRWLPDPNAPQDRLP